MQYGYFDDDAREYVITRPDTPRSWTNHLGSDYFGTVLTNNAGGYTFHRSGAEGRVTRLRFNAVPMDQPGKYLYLRDMESGDFWSTSWQPVGKPLEHFKSVCRHGTGYSVIESQYDGITSEMTYFIPVGKDYECWLVKLSNTSGRPRKLRAFSFVEFTSTWSTRNDMINIQYGQYIVKMGMVEGIIRYSSNDHLPPDLDNFINEDQGRWAYMGLVGAMASGFDTDREAFLGPYRSYHNPLVVEQGECTGSLAVSDNGCGTHQVDVELADGESMEFMVVLGIGKAEVEGKRVLGALSLDAARAALEEVKSHWHGQLTSLQCATPDPAFDSMVNTWNAYNRLITFRWSRAASLVYNGERDGLGYRDTVQDIVAAISAVPEEARQQLELMFTGQFSTGGAMPIVKPFAHRPGTYSPPEDIMKYRSDDCLWLFNATQEYVKETGDLAFYEKSLPYADTGEATVLGHLRRALEFNLTHTGANGLPCGLLADWNDCIEFGETGESTFVAFQTRLGLATYIEVCEKLNRPEEVAWAQDHLEKLDQAIREFAWEGQWFRRGTEKNGAILGSKDNEEGKIFLNAQSWAVLSGFADEDTGRTAMDAVQEHLATEYGIMVCMPPFTKASVETVRAVLMNPGNKENAGIFSHPQGWAVMAECILGRGDLAYEYYRAYMPAAQNDKADIREIEPYVHCQSTHSRYSTRFGASRIPWLSGTAAWSYHAAVWGILGIQADYDGLRLDPCLPRGWNQIVVTRQFRGKEFRIKIENGQLGKGVASITLNGDPVEGNVLPIQQCNETNDVVVCLK
jgi:cellobiose phosphorylase